MEGSTAPGSPEASASLVAKVLYLSGAITIVIGIVLGLVVSPILFAVILVGIADIAIARLIASGRIGPLAARRRATESGDAAQVAAGDPSFNPYARED
jgi:hypothetical protein